MKHIYLFLVLAALVSKVSGQDLPRRSYTLDSIFIDGLTSKNVYKAYRIIDLPDTLADTRSLPELLEQNTAVFIKEYGRGMLASIALRGTSAAHTQIVWNGIPVNSILNGQTDLNSFSPGGFDEIYIKKGGSSVSFGGGAIGGVVIFKDKLRFKKAFHLSNQTKIGSFKTGLNRFQILGSNQKYFGKFGFQIQKSDNDYPYPGYNVNNDNGHYQGLDMTAVGGIKLNTKHELYLKSKISKLDRETSRTLYMPEDAKLLTGNTRLLSGWLWRSGHFISRTETAYLRETYRYYFNKNLPDNSQSAADTYIVKNLLNFGLHKDYKILIGNEYSRQTGTGDHINKHIRDNLATFVIWSHHLKKLNYQLKLRKDFNPVINIPLTGAIELNYPFLQHHNWRFNASKNFRLPTFNDLYWTPGGNPQLKPETSYSFATGYDYKNSGFEAHLSAFYIDSRNLIKWVPGQNNYWQPQNFASVHYSGVELAIDKKVNFNENWHLSNRINVNYHRSVNQKTQKLLPYTPQITGINLLKLTYKVYSLTYRYRYQGKIYTTTSNTKFLPAYQLHSVSLTFYNRKHINMQLNINNLLNTYYENIQSRPQPGRNYELILNFKI